MFVPMEPKTRTARRLRPAAWRADMPFSRVFAAIYNILLAAGIVSRATARLWNTCIRHPLVCVAIILLACAVPCVLTAAQLKPLLTFLGSWEGCVATASAAFVIFAQAAHSWAARREAAALSQVMADLAPPEVLSRLMQRERERLTQSKGTSHSAGDGLHMGRLWHSGCETAIEELPGSDSLMFPFNQDATANLSKAKLRQAAFHIADVVSSEAPGACHCPPVLPPGIIYQQTHDDVSVLFADIAGFTSMSEQLAAEQVLEVLHQLFCSYDDLLDQHGVYKVETIGDCYMAAAGLLQPTPQHAQRMVEFAKAMLAAAATVRNPVTGAPLQVRVGIHSGSVVSAVVGTCRARYGLFGDTVNTASRMESTGRIGAIQVSEATWKLLPNPHMDPWEMRMCHEVKGKEGMRTYLLRVILQGLESSSSGSVPEPPDAALRVEGLGFNPNQALILGSFPEPPDAASTVEG